VTALALGLPGGEQQVLAAVHAGAPDAIWRLLAAAFENGARTRSPRVGRKAVTVTSQSGPSPAGVRA